MAVQASLTKGTLNVRDLPRNTLQSSVPQADSRIIIEGRLVPVANVTETLVLFVCPKGFNFIWEDAYLATGTVPSDADGTVLGNLIERDASADSEASITASQNLEALVAFEGVAATQTIALPRTLDEFDTIRFTIVNNTAAIDVAGEVVCGIMGRLVKKVSD